MARRSKTAGITTDSAGNKTIDKICFKERVFVRLGPVSQQQAEEYLAGRIQAIRRRKLYAERPQKTFREAAIRYLRENGTNASIDDDAWHVDLVDPWIGELSLQQVHDGTLEAFKTHRLKGDGVSPTTLKRTLEMVRKILNASARSYRDDNGRIWLETAPPLTMPVLNPRKPHALSWDEQRELFGRLPRHLARMALFAVSTGCREQEVCRLRWEWEQRIPELGATVFVIPANFGGRRRNSGVKNGEDRIVDLNRVACSVIEECRGQHPECVFVLKVVRGA
jgi:integrase